ncbi:hypothetical protein SDC9_165478 [bioreactor metagenome]|uniref:Uncharacterized protein n=1 Tax=bioreactor metagenome TaxID=1076179 RepID=A0A645FWS8_9ZZZZ
MIIACRGYVDDLPTEGVDQRGILSFWIDYDNVVLSGEHELDDLLLGDHGLAGAGHAENHGVAV